MTDTMLRKTALSVLVLVAAGAAAATGSRAYPGGPLRISDAPAQALRIESSGTLPGLAAALPGTWAAGDLTVANRGSLSACVELELTAAGPTGLRSALRLVVTRAGARLYAGRLRAVQRFELGALAPGELAHLRVRVGLAARAGEPAPGRPVRLGGRFDAVTCSST